MTSRIVLNDVITLQMSWSEERTAGGDSSHEDALVRFSGDDAERVFQMTPTPLRQSAPSADTHSLVNRQRHPSGCIPHVHVTHTPSHLEDQKSLFCFQNMTATCNLGCALDLPRLACSTRNTEYNPNGLPGAIMRLVDPKSVALIFDSGHSFWSHIAAGVM